MSRFEVKTSIPVKDVMSSPVVTVYENNSVAHIAKLLAERDIGSIVVIDRKENPIGLITERDIVVRVTAKNLLPSNVEARAVMSTPLRTIGLEIDIKEAAENMRKHNIRRLIVMDKDKMVGIVSSRDIVAITPALIEIIIERARIKQGNPMIVESSSANYCDRCGQWSETLVNMEGKFICEECRIDIELE